MKQSKIAIIHHNKDADGLMSGYLADKVFGIFKENSNGVIDFDLIGYNYEKDEESTPWLNIKANPYTHYVFIDVTPPIDWIKKIQNKIATKEINVAIFDHHINIYNEFDEAGLIGFDYVFDEKMCGASIFYESFMVMSRTSRYFEHLTNGLKIDSYTIKELFEFLVNDNLAKFVYLVQDYDTWAWKENGNINALAINEYMLPLKTVNDFGAIIENCKIEDVISDGLNIITRKKLEAKNTKKLFVEIDGINVCVINKKANTYDIDDVIAIDTADELSANKLTPVCLFYTDIDFVNNFISFSLRATYQDFDVNKFVKKLCDGNGGGHTFASGGATSLNKFLKFFE